MSKKAKKMDGGYITNCFLVAREDGPLLFDVTGDGYVKPQLDYYAIVPLEEYAKFVGDAAQLAPKFVIPYFARPAEALKGL